MAVYEICLKQRKQILNENVSCVYRIWFGDKYYIGKTMNLHKRMLSHKYDLTRYVMQYDDGFVNPYYEYWVRHIIGNKLWIGYYEILTLCKDEITRVRIEQSWFNVCCDDANCLNYGYESKEFVFKKTPNVIPLNNADRIKYLKKTIKAISKLL